MTSSEKSAAAREQLHKDVKRLLTEMLRMEGVSRKELAARLQVTRSAVDEAFATRRGMTLDRVAALATELGYRVTIQIVERLPGSHEEGSRNAANASE